MSEHGGAPYSLTFDQYQVATPWSSDECRDEMAQRSRPGWARAREILSDVFVSRAPQRASVEIGWVRPLDEGLFRKGYFADVSIDPDPEGESGCYVVLLPNRDADPDFDAHDRERVERTAHEKKAHSSVGTPSFVDELQGKCTEFLT